jgi:hypothetical protein
MMQQLSQLFNIEMKTSKGPKKLRPAKGNCDTAKAALLNHKQITISLNHFTIIISQPHC